MNDDQPVPTPTPEAPAVATSTKVVISKEDRFELENYQVKMQNVQLQLQIMQSDLQKALNERNRLVEGMKQVRDRLQKKYGVDVARVTIDDEGNISPLPQNTTTGL